MKRFAGLFAAVAAAGIAVFAAEKNAPPKYGCDLFYHYIPLAQALAADAFKPAQAAAAALSKQAVSNGLTGVVEKAKAVAEARDLLQARAAFKLLSEEIEPLAAFEKETVVMYCPAADASWVQLKGPVENPYYGKAKLDCGSPKAEPLR